MPIFVCYSPWIFNDPKFWRLFLLKLLIFMCYRTLTSFLLKFFVDVHLDVSYRFSWLWGPKQLIFKVKRALKQVNPILTIFLYNCSLNFGDPEFRHLFCPIFCACPLRRNQWSYLYTKENGSFFTVKEVSKQINPSFC